MNPRFPSNRMVLRLHFVVWVLCLWLLAAASALAAPEEAIITHADGIVSIRQGPNGPWLRPKSLKNTVLHLGDGLSTGDKSFARLVTNEGVMLVSPNSKIELSERPRRSFWRLVLGKIAAFLYGKPRSYTGAGEVTAASRGTHYQLIRTEDDTVTLIVIEGTVDFSNPHGQVEVSAGYESTALRGKAPRPPIIVTDLEGAIAWEADLEAVSLPVEYPISRLSDPAGMLPSLLSSQRLEDWISAGDILLSQGNPTEAEDQYRRALEADPSLASGWAHLGFLRLTAGQLALAQEAIDRAISISPAGPEALTARGALLLSRRKTEEAIQNLNQAAAAGLPAARAFLGLSLLRQGKIEEARKVLDAVVKSDPDAYVARVYLSGLELMQGRLQEADRQARMALEAAPDSGLAQAARASALFYQGHSREAAQLAMEAARRNPSLTWAHLTLARTFASEGRLQEGVSEAIRAVALDPDDPHAHSVLGALLLTADDLPHAEDAFRRALTLSPEMAFAGPGLGAVLTHQQRFREALSHLQAATSLDAGSAPAHNNLGALYTAQGHLNEAEKEFRAAVRLQPGWGMPHGNLALVHLERNEIAEAIMEGEQAIRLGERSALLHTILARIYLKQERVDRALDELRLAEAEDPTYPLALFLESEIYRRKDQPTDARRATVQGAAFDPGAISELRLYTRTDATADSSDEQSSALDIETNGRGDRGRSAFFGRGFLEDSDGYRSHNSNRRDRFGQGIFGYRPDYRQQNALLFSLFNRQEGRPGRQVGDEVEDANYRSDFFGWEASLTRRQSLGNRDFLLLHLGGSHRELTDTNPDSLLPDPFHPIDPKPYRRLAVAADTPTFEVRWDRDLLNGRRLTAGAALQEERRALNGLRGGAGGENSTPIIQRDTPRIRTGYLEYRFPIRERFLATLGGYAGKRTRLDTIALPKARLQYNAPDGGRLVLLVQPTFRADATLLAPIESWSGPQPVERSRISEDGSVLSYEVHYERPGRKGSFQKATLYWRAARGLLIDLEDPRQAPLARRAFFRKARLLGTEIAYEAQPAATLSARFWARYEEAKDRAPGGGLLPYSPRWQGGVRFDHIDRSGWRVGWELAGFGRRSDETGDTSGLAGEILSHLRITKQQGIWTAYFLELRNLFDTHYEYWRGYPAQGRVVRLGLEQRF